MTEDEEARLRGRPVTLLETVGVPPVMVAVRAPWRPYRDHDGWHTYRLEQRHGTPPEPGFLILRHAGGSALRLADGVSLLGIGQKHQADEHRWSAIAAPSSRDHGDHRGARPVRTPDVALTAHPPHGPTRHLQGHTASLPRTHVEGPPTRQLTHVSRSAMGETHRNTFPADC